MQPGDAPAIITLLHVDSVCADADWGKACDAKHSSMRYNGNAVTRRKIFYRSEFSAAEI